MKTIKTCIIATIVTALIICSCACIVPACAESYATELGHGEFYPKLTVVIGTTKIESGLWIVDCRDREGNVWSFFDDEGTWVEGDIANLLMWDLGEREEEHEIIEVYWDGYTENVTEWLHTMEWC